MSFTLLILVLSKETLIFFVKQNQSMANGENMTHVGAWHRLVTCCRSLTGCTWQLRLYWTVTCMLRVIYLFSFYAYRCQYFTFFCQEMFVLKCCLLYWLLHIFTHTTGYFWSYETKHWSLKSNLNLIPKCHKLTHISFIKINMKHDPEWNPD